MWGHKIRVVILPIILVFAFIGPSKPFFFFHLLILKKLLSLKGTWIASITPLTIVQSQIVLEPSWSHSLLLFSLSASMTVNTLVTGLIVFKIFKVFRDTKVPFRKDATVSSNHSSIGGNNRLRSIIFILIESGAALFCIQLIRLAVSIAKTNIGVEVFDLIVGIHQMLNVSVDIYIQSAPYPSYFFFSFSKFLITF